MASSPSIDLDVVTIIEISPSLLTASVEPRLARVAGAVLDAEGQSGRWEVAFVLVDDDRLQALHREFMAIDEPTDVMTFERSSEDGEPDEPGSMAKGGDIVISIDRAAEQATEGGNTAEREVLFLAIHGMLHLTGWVDHSAEQRAAMLDRGESILRRVEASSDVASG